MTTPEGRLKKEIKALLDERGAFWSLIPGGSYAKTGDPDIVVCYKGRYVGIEAKTPVGMQSQWQRLREEQIKAAGGVYILARSTDDVRAMLDEIDWRLENEGQDNE